MDNALIFKFKSAYELKKSPNSKLIAVLESKVKIYDGLSGKLIKTFSDLKHPNSMCFSNCSNKLLINNTAGDIVIYNMASMERDNVFQSPGKDTSANIFMSPDNYKIITADHGGRAYVIDTTNNFVKEIFYYPGHIVRQVYYNNKQQKYSFLVIKPGDEGTNFLIDWEYISSEIKKIDLPNDSIKLCYNYENDTYLIKHPQILVHYTNQFTIINSIPVSPHVGSGIDWSKDGKYVLYYSNDVISILNAYTFKFVLTLNMPGVFFAEFVDADNDERIFIGTFEGVSYYTDFEKLMAGPVYP